MKLETASHTELIEAALQYYRDKKLTAKDIELLSIAFSVNEQRLRARIGATV